MRHLCLLLGLCLAIALPSAALCHKSNSADQELSLMEFNNGHTLYVVGYAHLDTQWRWAYPQVIREYLPNTLAGNFRLIDKYPNYVFNFSGSRRYQMVKEYYPAEYEKLKRYIDEGRWFPCGSSVDECDANVPGAESIIRQVLYGNQYFKDEFGRSSAEFMLPDCFGFPASMPALLHHCGLKGFSTQKLSWGSAQGIPFNVGVWEGLDGSSIIVGALNPGAYVGKVTENLAESDKWLERIDANGQTSGVFKDYHYFGTGDIGGPPEEKSVAWIQESANTLDQVRVVSATAEQMFLDLSAEDIAKLPRYRGDLLLTEHSAGSITSQAYMKRWNRMNELLADGAERAAVAANWLGGSAYPNDKLKRAWELTLGSQMHDILPGTSIPKAYEYSWNDEVLSMNLFADVLETSVGQVASGLDTRGNGVALVVYNPLSIEREDIVEATVDFGTAAPQFVQVFGPGGAQAPAQVLSRTGNRAKIAFVAQVPSVGLSVYHVRPHHMAMSTQLSVSATGMENERFKVAIDANGDVSSIFDKLAGRETLSAPIRLAFVQDDPGYWPAWNIDWDDQQRAARAFLDGPAQIRIAENGPARVAIEVTRSAEDSTIVQQIRLSAGRAGDRIEFHNVIDWRSSAASLKAVFPLAAKNPLATYSWEVGTIQRGNNDEKKYEVPHHHWFDLTDVSGEFGATVISPFKYGSDKPDDGTLRLTLLRTPGVGSYDYADQATQDWGRHEISYALAPHKGSWNSERTDWQAMRAEQQPYVFQSPQHAGALGPMFSLAEVSHPRVRMLALKKAEDSDELIVRLVELSGEPASNVQLKFPSAIVSAHEVNGQEEEIAEASLSNGSLITELGPYTLRSFALRLAAPAANVTAPQSQPVALNYDTAVASFDNERSGAGFDSGGRCLPAEMLPASFTDAGINFDMGPHGSGASNALRCNGQEVALPGGSHTRLYIIAGGSPAGRDLVFEVDGKPQTLSIQDWGGYLGQWDNRVWEGRIPELAFQWPYPLSRIEAGYTRRDPVAWFSSHRHNADGTNDIYEYAYLYRYALDIHAGAKLLKLPVAEHVKIMAISAASDSTAGFRAAAPLYDTLESQIGIGHDELPNHGPVFEAKAQ